MKNSVNWFEISVDNMERAKAFYAKVFKKELMDISMPDESEMCAFPWEEGAEFASGALIKSPQSKPGVGGTTVYFHCEDCADEQSRVEQSGGKVIQPKFAIGEHGFISVIQDSEGNTIGLHSRK